MIADRNEKPRSICILTSLKSKSKLRYSSMPLYGQFNTSCSRKGVNKMRKSFVVFMTAGLVLTAGSGVALAGQDNGDGFTTSYTAGVRGNIVSNQYDLSTTLWNDGNGNTFTFNNQGVKNWSYKEQGTAVTSGSYTGAQGFPAVPTSTVPGTARIPMVSMVTTITMPRIIRILVLR